MIWHDQTMDAKTLKEIDDGIAALYAAMEKRWPNFSRRPEQLRMIHAVKDLLLSQVVERDGSNIGCIEGETGVGKSAAYAIPAAVISHALECTVVISTKTVALQEQLVDRDLPGIAALCPFDLKFALLKGRGRYVCPVRLHTLLGEANQGQLLSDEAPLNHHPGEEDARALRAMSKQLSTRVWDGDRDKLQPVVANTLWSRIGADHGACPGRRCPQFAECPFYTARTEAKTGQVLVANHDLVLAALDSDSKAMPAPEDTLYVFDEGHHLPDIALQRFSHSCSVSSVQVLVEGTVAVLKKFSAIVPSAPVVSVATEAQSMIERAADLDSIMQHLPASEWSNANVMRFKRGIVPPAIEDLVNSLHAAGTGLLSELEKCVEHLKAERSKGSESHRDAIVQLLADVEVLRAQFLGTLALLAGWQKTTGAPEAKWVERVQNGRTRRDYVLHSSPLTAASALSRMLWRRVKAACIVSATLSTGGDFTYFGKLSGLRYFPQTRYERFASPFDYERQGSLHIPAMRSDPKDVGAHTQELIKRLPGDLESCASGQLMLFTSRKQLDDVFAQLPAALKADILVQNAMPRGELLREHKRRVANGQRSVIFGLQSFGEGLDLPGALCEHLLIAKLPFSPPDSPVEEALAEWLEEQHRNPFQEITVPKAAMVLKQWAGRAIRTEVDCATITLLDPRIRLKSYGKTLLKSLPPYRLVRC